MAVRLGDPVEKSFGREDINDRYHRYDKILGRGAYKTVYWGWDTQDGVDVAWNCIDLDALPTAEERRKISREVEMLQQLKHKHILRIRDHWENPKTNQLCFITDILQGGSLREYIRQRKVNLGRVKSWCLQILDALNYLHNSDPVIIHRDLKCDNIFIDGPSGNITIGDLGLSTKYNNSNTLNEDKGMSIVGTPEFMAPELYEEQYDEKVDIYAFGMSVLEMISKKYPYEECTNQIQVIRKVTEKKQPDILRKLHRYVRTFIELCIERDPKKRPSAQELIKHPFLTYMDDLKNKQPVSDFVLTENKAQKYYKSLESKENESNTTQTKNKQLSTIPESGIGGAGNKSPSPHHERINATITTKKGLGESRNSKISKKLKSSKKKYVSGTTVSIEDGGNIEVKLKIHHDKESQKVKFMYNPQTEDITSVVKEMVETLELDQNREHEILRSIQTKLNTLDTSPRPSTPMHASKKSISTSAKPPSSNIITNNQNDKPSTQFSTNEITKSMSTSQPPPPPLNANLIANAPSVSGSSQAQTVTSPARDRAGINNFEFPNNNGNQPQIQQRATEQRSSNGHGAYTEPSSASANPPNQPQFYSEPPSGNNQQSQGQFEQNINHFPKVFNPNGTTVAHQQQTSNNNCNNNPNNMLPITQMLTNVNSNNQRQLRSKINTNQPLQYIKSAPVTPGQSPENENKMGHTAATGGGAGLGGHTMHRGGYVSDTGSDYVPPRQLNNNQAQNQGQPQQSQPNVPQTVVSDNISDHSNATNTTTGTNTKPINDSLLDQIMALPRETIKSRIIQFGGSYSEHDGTAILVTKLFQLLSANDSKPSKPPQKQPTQIPRTQQQAQPPTATTNGIGLGIGQMMSTSTVDMDISSELMNDDNSQLLIRHIPSTNSIQTIGSQHNLQNLNGNNNKSRKSEPTEVSSQAVPLHGYNNINPTPPTTTRPYIQSTVSTQGGNTNNKHVSISPPNELIHPPPPTTIQSNNRQISTESINSHHSFHSQHSITSQTQQSQHTDSPKSAISPRAGNHIRTGTHSHNSSNASNHMIQNLAEIVDKTDEEMEEMDPKEELQELRVRQKELMKAKIQSQMRKLKERNPTQLGRDNALDDIASELAEVEKQIKILTDASKQDGKRNEKRKITKNKRLNRESSNPEIAEDTDNKHKNKNKKKSSKKHSRTQSIEPEIASNHPSTYHTRNNSAEPQKVTPPRNSKQQDTNNNVSVRPKPPKQALSQPPTINEKPELSLDHNINNMTLNHSVASTKSNTNSVSNSMLLDNTEEVSMNVNESYHISSPLVNPSHRDEFNSHLRNLPKKLDLSDIAGDLGDVNVYINSLFNKSQSNLKAVSDQILKNAKDRAIREKRQLEDEYKQYYADQTEMLLLKLQKHRQNHQKCAAETQSTQLKLVQKQTKQRTKFKSIVKDQLQILQLTQELNDDGNAIQIASVQSVPVSSPLQNSAVPPDEFYLYKEDMDKIYLEKVREFEAKQKRELDAFRTDLKQLNELRLEVKKRNLIRVSLPGGGHHAPSSAASSPKRGSPARMDQNDEGRLFGFNVPALSQNGSNNQQNINPFRDNINNDDRRHSHSRSSPAIQIDILTGYEEVITPDENINGNANLNGNPFYRPIHAHSTSLPLIEGVPSSQNNNGHLGNSNNNNSNSNSHNGSHRQSKFKVTQQTSSSSNSNQQQNVVTFQNNRSNPINQTYVTHPSQTTMLQRPQHRRSKSQHQHRQHLPHNPTSQNSSINRNRAHSSQNVMNHNHNHSNHSNHSNHHQHQQIQQNLNNNNNNKNNNNLNGHGNNGNNNSSTINTSFNNNNNNNNNNINTTNTNNNNNKFDINNNNK